MSGGNKRYYTLDIAHERSTDIKDLHVEVTHFTMHVGARYGFGRFIDRC